MNYRGSISTLLLSLVAFITGLATALSLGPAKSPTPLVASGPVGGQLPTPTPTPPAQTVTLPITVLRTGYGIYGPDGKPPVPSYPPTVTVIGDNSLVNKVAAYGVDEKILIAPRGWVGEGNVGADGGASATLYPSGANPKTSDRIIYDEVPACVSCAWGEAARYFPNALAEYEKNYPGIAVMAPPLGLSVQRVSDTLVRYSLADTSDGLSTNGVAYYKMENGQPYFTSLEVRLPQSRDNLSAFLLDDFIARHNLK